MFEDSLFASNQQQHDRRGAALVSFAAQILLVGTSIILPVLFTDALPMHNPRIILQIPTAPPRYRGDVIVQQAGEARAANNDVFHVPRENPRTITQIVDPPSLPEIGMSSPSGVNGAQSGGHGDQLSAILLPGPSVNPVMPKPQTTKRVRVSDGVERGLLIQEVKPVYPLPARQAGVQGEVVLQAVIGKDGSIEKLRLISGSPLLAKAALDAVQRWRYRPYLLNGIPVEVETQITVKFNLS